MTNTSAGCDESPSELEMQRELATEFRLAAGARAEEITHLLQTVDELTDRVTALEGELANVTGGGEVDPAGADERNYRRLRALEQRKSVRLILRLDSMIGRRDAGTAGRNASR